MPKTALKVSCLAGLIAVLIGVLDLANGFSFFLDSGESGENSFSAHALAKMGLILCEMFVDLVFAVAALALGIWYKSTEESRSSILLTGFARLLLLGIMMGLYWSEGWYYILDPNGSHRLYILALILSIIQTLSFFLALIKTKVNSEKEP